MSASKPLNNELPGGGVDDVPAHVRDDRSVEPDDGAGPLAAALRLDAELHAAREQDLHADTHPEHRATRGHSLGDDLVAADVAQSGHAGLERADTGHHQPVGPRGRTGVGGHFDVGADPLQRPLCRSQVAGTVVEDNDGFPCHRVPLVDGTPVTRGSNSTA